MSKNDNTLFAWLLVSLVMGSVDILLPEYRLFRILCHFSKFLFGLPNFIMYQPKYRLFYFFHIFPKGILKGKYVNF